MATALHRRGQRVVLVDADPQGTTRDWREASPEGAELPAVIALDRPQLPASIATLAADVVIIDAPAKAESLTAGAMRIAHTALLVMQPSGADLWASAAVVKLIRQKLDLGGSLDAAFLINRTSPSTRLSRLVKAGDWNEYGLEQLDATLGNRVAFANALTDGLSVYDLPDLAARAEVEAVIAEVEIARWL
jgi:chromosome partitioning protein